MGETCPELVEWATAHPSKITGEQEMMGLLRPS